MTFAECRHAVGVWESPAVNLFFFILAKTFVENVRKHTLLQ